MLTTFISRRGHQRADYKNEDRISLSRNEEEHVQVSGPKLGCWLPGVLGDSGESWCYPGRALSGRIKIADACLGLFGMIVEKSGDITSCHSRPRIGWLL